MSVRCVGRAVDVTGGSGQQFEARRGVGVHLTCGGREGTTCQSVCSCGRDTWQAESIHVALVCISPRRSTGS